jgi:hypothetical protein
MHIDIMQKRILLPLFVLHCVLMIMYAHVQLSHKYMDEQKLKKHYNKCIHYRFKRSTGFLAGAKCPVMNCFSVQWCSL